MQRSSLLLLLLLMVAPAPFAQEQHDHPTSQLTTQRFRGKGWWPTKTDAAREDYIGVASCAECHKQVVSSQQETAMAHAASRGSETAVFRSQPKLSFSTPPFQTVITRDHQSVQYVVSGRGDSITSELLWSIGNGVKGETFILNYLGMLFESQLSYFPSIGGLDITPEHPRTPPEFPEAALGAPQTDQSAQQCFGCHTTASSVQKHFDPDHAVPGVSCEACHGPGASHVKAVKAGQIKIAAQAILDPGSLGPVDSLDFCGACHRAPADVAAAQDHSPLNIRYQPYRLSKSRCWTRPDPRLTCVACHDPHEPLVREAAFYDSKCLACHATTTVNEPTAIAHDQPPTRPRTCPISKDRCVSCHMPKYTDPQFHGSFTDHDIRIVRPGDPYPL